MDQCLEPVTQPFSDRRSGDGETKGLGLEHFFDRSDIGALRLGAR